MLIKYDDDDGSGGGWVNVDKYFHYSLWYDGQHVIHYAYVYYVHVIITFYLIYMINALLHYVPSSSTVYAQFIINYLFALRQIIWRDQKEDFILGLSYYFREVNLVTENFI